MAASLGSVLTRPELARSQPAWVPQQAAPQPACTVLAKSLRLSAARQQRHVAAAAGGVDLSSVVDEDGDEPQDGRRGRRNDRQGAGRGRGRDGPQEAREPKEFEERVLQLSRVTKVVKGGKQVQFRAVVVVGDLKGRVGVGCDSAKEVIDAVQKATVDAKKHVISVPLSRIKTFPNRRHGYAAGAKVMLRPAGEGTGVIAGGAVKNVLELAGVENAFGKQLGSTNPLNNARAAIDALRQQVMWSQICANRDLSFEQVHGMDNVRSLEDIQSSYVKPYPREDNF